MATPNSCRSKSAATMDPKWKWFQVCEQTNPSSLTPPTRSYPAQRCVRTAVNLELSKNEVLSHQPAESRRGDAGRLHCRPQVRQALGAGDTHLQGAATG